MLRLFSAAPKRLSGGMAERWMRRSSSGSWKSIGKFAGGKETKGNVSLLSQKRNRKPVEHVCWLRLSRGSLLKKTENLRNSSKLDSLFFSAFFSLLRKPAEQSSADCRLVGLCGGDRRFAAAKRAGDALRRVILSARFSRRKNGAPSQATPHNHAAGRSRTA